jgi:hypothetical protein
MSFLHFTPASLATTAGCLQSSASGSVALSAASTAALRQSTTASAMTTATVVPLYDRLADVLDPSGDVAFSENVRRAALRIIEQIAAFRAWTPSFHLPLIYGTRRGEISFEWRPEVTGSRCLASLLIAPHGSQFELFWTHDANATAPHFHRETNSPDTDIAWQLRRLHYDLQTSAI